MTLDSLAQSMLIPDLAEFLGMPISEVWTHTLQGHQSTMDAEKDWQGSREDFYRSPNDCWLFDLTDLNTQPDYWESRIAPLVGLKDGAILDFGCGIGTATLFLALRRNRVYGYDINPRVLEFAEFRKNRFGLSNIIFSDKLPDLSQFDAMIAIDVLEHIEDLHGLLLYFGQGLKQGARFYHVDSFSDVHPHPLHNDRPEDLDGWLREAGFIILNRNWAIATSVARQQKRILELELALRDAR